MDKFLTRLNQIKENFSQLRFYKWILFQKNHLTMCTEVQHKSSPHATSAGDTKTRNIVARSQILQGASATERWLQKVEKTRKNLNHLHYDHLLLLKTTKINKTRCDGGGLV